MPGDYLRTAIRQLLRNGGITTINVAGLTIGLTAAALILVWVKNELSFDQYHTDASRIYRVTDTVHVNKTEEWVWEHSPFLLAEAANKSVPGIAQTARVSIYDAFFARQLKVDAGIFKADNPAIVDEGWFRMFDYRFVEGGVAAFSANPFGMVITQAKAQQLFGTSHAFGKTVRVDTVNYTVTGVVTDNPGPSSFQFDVILPASGYLSDSANRKNAFSWGNFNYQTYVKLVPGVRPAAVAASMQHIFMERSKDSSTRIGLEPLAKLHFESAVQNAAIAHGNSRTVWVMLSLAVLLIMTACINYVNLTTARAGTRLREISIRKINGAARFDLFLRFASESLLTSVIVLVLALAMSQVLLPTFNRLTDSHFTLSLYSGSLWLVFGSAILLATLLNSIYPALVLSSFSPLHIFRGKNILSVSNAGFRKTLVIFQFSIAAALIVSVIVIYRQMNFIQTTNPGYDRDQVVEITIPFSSTAHMSTDRRSGFTQDFVRRLGTLPGVVGASAATAPITNIENTTSGGAYWKGRPQDFKPTLSRIAVDSRYKEVFGLQMAQGRWFSENSPGDRHNVILNETAVRQLGLLQPAIGQWFVFQGDTGVVIGVAKDFHYKSMHERIGPLVISNHARWYGGFYVRIAPGSTRSVISGLQRIWRQTFPESLFEYNFIDDSFNHLYKSDQRLSKIILVFSIIVVVISCMGLFALAAFTAASRIREIGIRKVLGATAADITLLLSTDFVKLVLIAVVIASPIAGYFMHQWLQDFAYRVDLSWWVFAAAAMITILITLTTVGFKALQAAAANPAQTLKTE